MSLSPVLSDVHDESCRMLVLLLLQHHHELDGCTSLVQRELHRHGGHPEPGGDWVSQKLAAQKAHLLLDRHPQDQWRLDLGGDQQNSDSRGNQLGKGWTEQRQEGSWCGAKRGLCGDVHQKAIATRQVERWEVYKAEDGSVLHRWAKVWTQKMKP